ncbi:prenyltransferase/squalene oxidase repeat-containing protein [Nocardioides sp. Kera G14]|uniref:prenyltransferase/squalene oxidase repeat-containing protein n=1 Tax=Nocardioides sp. Kera G14 TaxID=2884264 RepID=UPI001D12430D|nr:prenyltransferase/squalene oxidase repeat-containing protein [Nocardioides sp. Kera G14]UDY24532.1 terpene cyclase/mutase family protein [Nocardioides sp. Kera G14]
MSLRIAPTLAAAALTAAGLTFVPSAAHAVDAQPVGLTDAIAWLNSKADSNGLLPGFDGKTASIAVTADVAKSLSEVADPTAATVASKVAAAAHGQIGSDSAASQEIAAGLWASQFATPDSGLLTELESDISDGSGTVSVTTYPAPTYTPTTKTSTVNAAATGRLTDKTFNEYTGTDAQAWAVLALAQAASAKTDAALHYLLDQQCADGGFRTKFSPIDASAQTCADDSASTDTDLTASSPDATGSAVLFLSALPASAKTDAVTTALSKATDWLVEDQSKADGSFSEWYGVSGNSTGIAGRALRVVGKAGEARKAAVWLRGRQAVAFTGCPTPLAKDRGALSYNEDTFAGNLASGLDAAGVGSAVSVTAQSLAALGALPTTNPTPTLSVPALRSGATGTLRISGANPGDALCVTVAGTSSKLLRAGATGASITAPTGVASAPISVTTASGATARASFAINTATSLKVIAKKKIKRGKRLAVTITGLWAGEKVTIKLGKKRFGTALANSGGKATVKKKVAKSTKLGKAKLAATGAFANRTGTVKIKVTR